MLEGAEAGEMASDYGKRLFRRAADMSKHLDPLGPKGAAGGRGMEDVGASQVEAHLTQRAESVLTDADQVLVTEVASRAGEVMARWERERERHWARMMIVFVATCLKLT